MGILSELISLIAVVIILSPILFALELVKCVHDFICQYRRRILLFAISVVGTVFIITVVIYIVYQLLLIIMYATIFTVKYALKTIFVASDYIVSALLTFPKDVFEIYYGISLIIKAIIPTTYLSNHITEGIITFLSFTVCCALFICILKCTWCLWGAVIGEKGDQRWTIVSAMKKLFPSINSLTTSPRAITTKQQL